VALGEIPIEFQPCVSVDGTRVSLADRKLGSLPDWVENLPALTTLDLSGNHLTGLPSAIGNLTSLTTLDLSGNHLTGLPSTIENLTSLTTLRLFRNRLRSIPDSIGNLSSLTTLDLSGNQLSIVPDSIGNLSALITLRLDSNWLTILPDSIGYLTALTTLELTGNRLTDLPESLVNLSSLTTLVLFGNLLADLPRSIVNLTSLATLGLFRNQLTRLPDSIENLTALTTLDLRANQLARLPTSVGNLPALTTLRLSGNRLTELPGSIGNLTALTTLDLRGNQLTRLPDSVGNLTALTSLDLSGHRLTELPGSIGNLTALTTLDLRGNQLAHLPDSVGNLTALTSLDLTGNELTDLPGSIGNLNALTSLDLSHQRLTDLPSSIGNLLTLTTLDLSGNKLTRLPRASGNLTALKTLRLSGNRLTELPGSIGNLTALTTLGLRGNQLAHLPDSIGNLTALTSLDLTGNQLIDLPDSIGNLTALTSLDLTGNQLIDLPDSIGNLTALTSLDLSGHRLTELPSSIGNLTALTSLDLTGNKLTILPWQLADPLTKGLHLKLSGNPLSEPLPELVMRGADALAAYLSSLDDAIAQYEAKMLLVGEGNVGKSSLVAAFSGFPFIVNRPTTHGIEISPLTLRHPTLDLDMTIRAWDFGGQEVYKVTHPFFFSRRSIYLVVWHAREGQEPNEVEGWLRRIRLHAGHNARAMVVATHCEERLPELDYRHLEQTFPRMLAGNFEVDNSTGVGLPRLSQAVGREAAQLPQMGQRISGRWASARDEILALAQTRLHIPYRQFAKICKRHRVTGREMVTLAQLMHDLGQIIYYGQDEGLKDIVVLNPEWLTKAISYVLSDTSTRDSGGVLDHARLKQIWLGPDGKPAYPAHYHPYFLRLMEKFDISYRLEDDELHSLVAQLVPHERPALPWQFKTQLPAGKRALALVCRLSEPEPGLIPWLTVRHHRASTGKYWRRGVFLRHPIDSYESEALVELRSNDELVIEVRAPSPDLYFNVLRDSVEDLITHRWPGLNYRLLIPCPYRFGDGSMCLGQFPLDSLLRMRERSLNSIRCLECLTEYQLSLLLTGFTVPTQPLTDQLTRIANHIAKLEDRAKTQAVAVSEIAESVRRVLRVVSTEVADCPRLFTLVLVPPSLTDRIRLDHNTYRLTLWCEHPGYWHPWEPASYQFNRPKDWFAKISPYASLIFRALQLVVPLAGSIAVASLPQDQLSSVQASLQLMNVLVGDLPSKPKQSLGEITRSTGEENQLTAAEGQALRGIRALLFDLDRSRAFGDMHRVQAPSGDLLWVCADHYHSDYDPGLPIVP
jgi:internalin A